MVCLSVINFVEGAKAFLTSTMTAPNSGHKMTGQSGSHGRRRGHERPTEDAPIIGESIAIQEDHQAAVDLTESNERKLKTRQGHRNKLKEIIEFLRDEYPDYYSDGVVEITEEQKNDPKFFQHNNTHDLVYTGLNVAMIKACMAKKKIKESGKMCSYKNLCKYHHAVKYGSEQANQPLPPVYYREMDKFLASFQKETRQAKQDGNLDEEESDPIPFPLYQQICEWAILSGNIFVWVYTVLQWNCIARSVSVDPLTFHNFSPGFGTDSIKCTYDRTKADQEGKKVSPKNLYANPFDPRISVFLALGCWICTTQETFVGSEKIFLNDGSKDGSASSRYCSQLVKLLKDKIDIVHQYVWPNHCNSHGHRKGAAVHITTATTCPAPILSMAARGEWSIGQVLDLYWQFGDPGDCFAGRSLAGLDPDSPGFAALPPHFVQGMENPHIKEGMELCFGIVLENHPDIEWLLLKLLASMIHEQEFLKGVVAAVPNHPFAGIPILTRPKLLEELAKLVTTRASEKIPHATGIPPHVRQLKMLRNLLTVCGNTFEKVGNLFEEVKQAAKEAIENAALGSGHITAAHLDEKIGEVKQYFDDQVENLTRLGILQTQGVTESTAATGNGGTVQTQYTYSYADRTWDVPEGFTLPANTNRRSAWDLWLHGDPNRMSVVDGKMKCTPIKPFRLLKPSRLPKDVATSFKLSWMPIMNEMTNAPSLEIPANASEITAEVSSCLFDIGTAHVRSKAAYIWDNNKYKKRDSWSVSTWSMRVRRASILKNGTEEDKRQLPEETRFNRPHTGQRKKRRKNARPGLAGRNQVQQDEATAVLRSMLMNVNPDAEAGIEEEVAEIEEEGRVHRARMLARAQTGLGDKDGNPLGMQQQPAGLSARDPNYRESLATALTDDN